MSKYLTNESIRRFLLDRKVSDNVMDMDLTFSDEEIDDAKDRAIMAYNELPPHVDFIQGGINAIPDQLYMRHAVTAELYLTKLSNLERNRVEAQAGNMTADPYKNRAQWFTNGYKLHREEFMASATSLKAALNFKAGYGVY